MCGPRVVKDAVFACILGRLRVDLSHERVKTGYLPMLARRVFGTESDLLVREEPKFHVFVTSGLDIGI